VPPNLPWTTQAVFNAIFTSASATVAAGGLVYPTYVTFASAGAQQMFSLNANTSQAGMFRLQVNSAGQISAKSGAQSGTISIDTMGWIDRRGRDG